MVRLYMDVHVHGAITRGLRAHGVEVLTAQEDGTQELLDPDLLDRATALGYVLFTNDDDLLAEAALRQQTGLYFRGVIYIHQHNLVVGCCIEDLELIAKVYAPEDIANRVEYLPL
jgi:predicted nuclease of predicted toxin-antitoxin system